MGKYVINPFTGDLVPTGNSSNTPQTASNTSLVPSGNITSVDVESAIAELDTKKIGTVTNIAALKNITPIDRQVIEVLGYHIGNDGGGGTFVWDAASSETDNGGTVIARTSGGTGRWERIYSTGFVNVLWFGAKRAETGGIENDAPSNVLCFNRALLVADTFVPNGLYWVVINKRSTDSTGAGATQIFASYDGIRVPAGKTLSGESQELTILKARANNQVVSGCSLMVVDSNATVRDLRIDGNRENISSSISPAFQCFLVRTAPIARNNIVFRNLTIHDCPDGSPSPESFALSLLGAKNCRVSNVHFYNASTGLNFNGDYPNNILGEDNIVENSCFHDCSWMGMTNYGVRNIVVRDCEFYKNARNGLNIEWTDNIHVTGIKSYNNGRHGIQFYGYTTGAKVDDSQCYNNADTSIGTGGDFCEISFKNGAWYTGNPLPRGTFGKIELNNVKLTPRVGNHHIRNVSELSESELPTVGFSQAVQITVNSPGAENWLYNKTGSETPSNFGHGFKFYNLKTFPTDFNIKPWYDWSKNGAGISTTNYTGTGNINSNCKVVTATSQFSQYRQLLTGGKKYLIRFRYNNSNTGDWRIKIGLLDGTQNLVVGKMARTNVDTSKWFECEYITDVPLDGKQWFVILICSSTSLPSSLAVDYLTIEEIVTGNTVTLGLPNLISNAFLTENLGIGNTDPAEKVDVSGNIKIRGGAFNSGHLLLGNYHLWLDNAGRLRTKNGIPTSDTDGSAFPNLDSKIVTSNYTATLIDHAIVANATAASFTIFLPPVDANTRKLLRIKNVTTGANTVTIAAASGQLIDDDATQVLTVKNVAIDLFSHATGWYIY